MAKKKGIVRGFFGSLLDVRKFSYYDDVKANAVYLARTAKDVCKRISVNESVKTESFTEAVQRMNLTERDINKRTSYFLYYSLIYLLVALVLLGYSVYLLLISKVILPTMASLVLTSLMLVHSFREHFWYMQMKKRKLGCTVKEWVRFVFRGVENEKK